MIFIVLGRICDQYSKKVAALFPPNSAAVPMYINVMLRLFRFEGIRITRNALCTYVSRGLDAKRLSNIGLFQAYAIRVQCNIPKSS
jgi:hypothetical protein